MIETINRLPDLSADTPLRPQDGPINRSRGFQELRDGIHFLANKPRAQFAEEVASLSMETKRIPDPYFYQIGSQGELMSPSNKGLVRDVVLRDSKVGELEFQALLKIENWAKDKKSGAIAWISPPEENVYDFSKIIVSEIREQDSKKILFNRAIVLDLDEAKCLQFAQSLANYSQNKPNFSSRDGVRATPFELNTNIHWSYVLEELIPDLSLEKVRTGEDLILKKQAVKQALEAHREATSDTGIVNTERFLYLAGNAGMVGERGSSCPPKKQTAFEAMSQNSLPTGENCKKIECRECHWQPDSREEEMIKGGQLTACPKCGWSPG